MTIGTQILFLKIMSLRKSVVHVYCRQELEIV